jgi:anaerobic selenocysteine-containing dehydrogenase
MKARVSCGPRILYPMKNVDFDPDGARNPQNRGSSGYVRISWDEALDMIANETKRQRQIYGPGARDLARLAPSVGNVGYYLSALLRFGDLLGFNRVHHNPDSWEGWYWGATHHYGNSMRVGVSGFV